MYLNASAVALRIHSLIDIDTSRLVSWSFANNVSAQVSALALRQPVDLSGIKVSVETTSKLVSWSIASNVSAQVSALALIMRDCPDFARLFPILCDCSYFARLFFAITLTLPGHSVRLLNAPGRILLTSRQSNLLHCFPSKHAQFCGNNSGCFDFACKST